MFEDRKQYYLVTELNESGDLYNYVKRLGKLNEAESKRIIFEILYAINHCHIEGICHRDLKPQNVLIDNENHIKVIDFGIAYQFNKEGENGKVKGNSGTPYF